MVSWFKAKQLNIAERQELDNLRKIIPHLESNKHLYSTFVDALTNPENRDMRAMAISELQIFYSSLLYDVKNIAKGEHDLS